MVAAARKDRKRKGHEPLSDGGKLVQESGPMKEHVEGFLPQVSMDRGDLALVLPAWTHGPFQMKCFEAHVGKGMGIPPPSLTCGLEYQ